MDWRKVYMLEALAKPFADATERVPPVHESPFSLIFGGPRSVVAVFVGGFASASLIYSSLGGLGRLGHYSGLFVQRCVHTFPHPLDLLDRPLTSRGVGPIR